MPEKSYFLKLTGATLLGLATLAVAALAVFLLSPYILPFFTSIAPFLVGAALIIVAILVIWMVLYAAAMVGVFLIYIFKPMKVNDRSGSYSMDTVKESGKREKGDSKGKKKEE